MVVSLKLKLLLFLTTIFHPKLSSGNINGESDLYLTVQNAFHFIQEDTDSLLFCHSTRKNLSNLSFSRVQETGQGSALPNASELTSLTDLISLRLVKTENSTRFGVYACDENFGNSTTRATVLKNPIREIAEVIPLQYNVRVFSGSPLNLTVEISDVIPNSILRWFHNDEEVAEWENEPSVYVPISTANQSGIYEAFIDGRRHLGLHALISVVVVRCPRNKWGSACEEDCPPCYNGGVCHPDLGRCVCPVGFNGDNCENFCPPGLFGENCEMICDRDVNKTKDSTEHEAGDECGIYMYCLPEPIGCTCGPGFSGHTCEDDCPDNSFGAGCTEECNCKNNDTCNRLNGTCPSGCRSGWIGGSCQNLTTSAEEYKRLSGEDFECPVDQYSFPYCNQSCHCAPGNTCDPVTGKCPFGCANGWTGESCSECPLQTYGPTCSQNCTCENGANCDPENGTCECVDKWKGEHCTEFAPTFLQFHDVEMKTNEIHKIIIFYVSGYPIPGIEISYAIGNDATAEDINATFREVQIPLGEIHNATSFEVSCTAVNLHKKVTKKIIVNVTDCPPLTYGPNCSQNCICFNGGNCNSMDGSCQCVDKWKGKNCTEFAPRISQFNNIDMKTYEKGKEVFYVSGNPKPSIDLNVKLPLNPHDITQTIKKINATFDEVEILVNSIDTATNFVIAATAVNDFGSHTREITVNVTELGAIGSIETVYSNDPKKIKLKWEPPANLTERLLGYQVSVEATDREQCGIKEKYVKILNVSTNEIELTDLSFNSVYQIGIKISTQSGLGKENYFPISTNESVPSAPPANVRVSQVTTTALEFQWDAIPCNQANGRLKGYEYTLESTSQNRTNRKKKLHQTKNNFVNLADLKPNENYEFAVRGFTDIGPGPWSESLTQQTSDFILERAINDVEIISDLPNELTLKWKLSKYVSKLLLGYQVSIEHTDRGMCDMKQENVTIPKIFENEFTLKNLFFNSKYQIVFKPLFKTGLGNPITLTVFTQEHVPSAPPTNVQVSRVTSTSIEFQWESIPCLQTHGNLIGYEYNWEPQSEHRNEGAKKSNQTKNNHVTLKDLEPNKFYEFAVRGFTAKGPGPWSKTLFQKTSELVFIQPELRLWQIRQSSFLIHIYNLPVIDKLIEYQVNISSEVENRTIFLKEFSIASWKFIDISDLTPNTKYSIKVRPANYPGYWSSPIEAYTLNHKKDNRIIFLEWPEN